MSEPTSTPTPPRLSKEERDRAKRNRGLRAAPPPPVAEKATAAPNGEVASIIDAIQAENEAAGLGKEPRPAETAQQPGDVEVVRESIPHDYEQNGPKTFTSLKGVVLRLKVFPHDTAIKIQSNMLPDRPKPPREYIEADDKWVENQKDPSYQEALGNYIQKASDIAFYVRVGMGTELHPDFPIPEDVWALDDDTWMDFISNQDLFGDYAIKARSVGAGRYLDWLNYYVLGEGEYHHLYELLDYTAGVVRERFVRKEIDSFRSSD